MEKKWERDISMEKHWNDWNERTWVEEREKVSWETRGICKGTVGGEVISKILTMWRKLYVDKK